jgi:Lrp/AsnC family leucine-responsive transcriptional regulator
MQYFNIESSIRTLDDVDWDILCELQNDARLTYAEIGRRVGLSSPAVAERVHRLEEAGIITGYRAQVDVTKLGLPLIAILRVRYPGDRYKQVHKLVQECPSVLSCDHVTGDDCVIIRLATATTAELEHLIGQFGAYGQTTTSLVLSSPVTERTIDLRDS